MASALAALFPSPLLAALTIIELGVMPKTYMECTVLMSITSFISFAIYYELQGTYSTYIHSLKALVETQLFCFIYRGDLSGALVY